MRNSVLFFLIGIASTALISAQTCTSIPGGATPDGVVSATANFSVGEGSVSVAVTNLLVNPLSVGQLLSGVQFTLTSGVTTGSLSSSSALVRNVKKAGAYTDLVAGATGWALDNTSGFLLCALCNDFGAIGPKRLLIGDPNPSTGTYNGANASIAGNKPHNPFTAGTAYFVITVPDAVAGDTVSSVTFFFGTAGGASGVPGVGVAVGGSCGRGPKQ